MSVEPTPPPTPAEPPSSPVLTGRVPRGRRRTLRAVAFALIVLGTFFVVAIAHRTLDVMVGTPIRTIEPGADRPRPAITDPEFRRTVEELIERPLLPGNRFELLTSGRETYPRLWDDMRGARRSITFQVYYCEPGLVADTVHEIMMERARAGVKVLFLADGFGCRSFPRSVRRELGEAGVELRLFRPVRWYTLHRAQHRSHVRAVVIDGEVGYTGGFGIDDKWFSPDDPAGEWRETNVRLTGPAVPQLQAAFAAAWAEATGQLLTGSDFFVPPAVRGPHAGALLYTTAGIGTSVAERFLALSILGASRTLYVINSYFVPDPDMRRLLREAASRGVDVRVLTAGPETDIPTVLLAGRSMYEDLLRAGVRIFEFEPAMMHAKAMVVDGAWLTVGTMNFDNRSLRLNEESNLVAFDPGLGASLDSLFAAYQRESREIRLEEFGQRPLWQRVLERGAGLLWFVL